MMQSINKLRHSHPLVIVLPTIIATVSLLITGGKAVASAIRFGDLDMAQYKQSAPGQSLHIWEKPCGNQLQGKVTHNETVGIIYSDVTTQACYGGTYDWVYVASETAAGYVASNFLVNAVGNLKVNKLADVRSTPGSSLYVWSQPGGGQHLNNLQPGTTVTVREKGPTLNVFGGTYTWFRVDQGWVAGEFLQARPESSYDPFPSPNFYGFSATNPVMPTSTNGDWKEFTNAPSGLWYDPPTPYGFEFETIGDTLFTGILDLPTGIDTDDQFTVWANGENLGIYGPGSSIDFGNGISSFKVTDITSENESTDFAIRLGFSESFGDFRMRAIEQETEEVPEPGFVLGTLISALLGRQLRKKAKGS